MNHFLQKAFLLSLCMASFIAYCQSHHVSFMQEQAEKYSKYNFTSDRQWDSLNIILNPGYTKNFLSKQKSVCTLNKVVYGWHPYWNGTVYNNYQWNLISRLSYCFYDVDYSTGSASSTHSWATAAVIDSALTHGVKVDLCVDLFSNLTSFLGNTAAKSTLITNLINLVGSRGANGVNIDFEGMTSSNKAAFTLFMDSLCTRMHTAIPGSKVSIATYAVDWGPVFDIPALNQFVDMFVIMGYDYYYAGSSTAGATDPLYDNSYCLTNTITYYLHQGVTPSKLILGLPYYGYSWATSSSTIHASTTASGSAILFNTILTNANGYYSTKIWDSTSFTPYYNYQVSSAWHQCWSDNYYSMGKRLDMVNQRGIGGIGIWALGYDDGYTGYWNKISDKLSTCATVACTDTIYDLGGPSLSYFSNENYTFTIAPTGASNVSLVFSSFSTQASHDTLKIYDGPNVASTLIGAYQGSNSPGTINSTGSSLTLNFKSDASTVSQGWRAVWHCNTNVDNISPTTAINVNGNWQTQNFTPAFTDVDNTGGSGIDKRFYAVNDYNGTEWRANHNNGFFNDNFDTVLNSDWHTTDSLGSWNVSNGHLNQTYTGSNKTRLSVPVTQDSTHVWLYQWQMAFKPGSTRRAGMYIMASDPTQTYLGSAYLVWFRADDAKCEIYYVKNNTMSGIVATAACTINDNTFYDYKVIYNPATGVIKAFQNNVAICSYTDTQPLKNAGYISLRTGNANMMYDDIKVYKSRATSPLVKVGAAATNDIRFQNPNPSTPAGRISSICNDSVGNLSTIISQNINIDWTNPLCNIVNDGTGADIDTTSSLTTLSANWTVSSDTNSGIAKYQYAIGTVAGEADVVSWTDNALDTSVTKSGLSLTSGHTYYFSVKSINGAGLSSICGSDGIVADFANSLNEINSGLYVSFFPNPFSGDANIYFTLDETQTVKISLIDMLGREIELVNSKFVAGKHSIAMKNNLVPVKGTYILKFIMQSNIKMIKIIKY